MKTLIFSEDQLHDLDKIGAELFADEKDPRSSAYVRKLVRPSVSWLKISLYIFIPLVISVAAVIGLRYMGLSLAAAALPVAAVLMVYILLMAKRACLCAIRIYQRYAPASIRNKCRFEPSCSEYMVLSIEKYGLLKGLKKGICRLKRCNINNGGFDYP